MVFATLGFYITIWFSKPAHRKSAKRKICKMIKNSILLFGVILLSGILSGQSVGIGTTSPNSSLDIVTKTNLNTNKVLKIVNTDGNMMMTGLDNGDFGIGKTLQYPDSQLTIFGINNNGLSTQPSYNATYSGNPQRWGIYINPKQDDLNPAYPGFVSMIFDNDGSKSTYYTTNNYGTFFGTHGSSVASGVFFAENGSTIFSTYRLDGSPYLTTTKITAYNSGSLRIMDENKGYAVDGSCINPGTIAFDSVNNNFIGCAEIYDAAGSNTGVMVWKKLNNN